MKEIRYTENAPKPIGPYSQAVISNGFLFISEQIPLKPDGSLVQGDIVVQTKQVLDNISEILKSSGITLNNVIKTTVFMTDIDDFAKMNEVYSEYFGDSKPARSIAEVSRIPKGVLIGIDAIAVI